MFQKRQLRIIYLVILIIVIVLIYKSFTQHKPNDEDVEQTSGGEAMLKPNAPVYVVVYYEALCPDSKNFVLHQLLPAYERAPELMDIEFVPFGKASWTTKSDGSLEFDCQHGPIECEANTIHACVVEAVREPKTRLDMVACMIKNNIIPRDTFYRCAKEHGVEIESIKKCYDSPHGTELLKVHGEATHALRPAVTFIPTVTLDGAQYVQKSILKDLFGNVCQVVSGRGPKPDVCK
ncbi:GILT-like protein 1 [Anopheles maculipalpis]|uniref:GILT-like protein 1 n=1 Tax=Anopheles maculipalpis TaxID=1496333 RepID=UPI002158C8D1|nr:GILT-like protein 1 [Anopheles maculipalpis]XP_050078444.1 GILT-like protein 1 [Anopheles maculipalpis]